MGLLLKDKLELLTPLGSQEIQLLFGDITKLPLEETVDVIFISAFYGNYTPVHSTLIGSLKTNLGIDVKHLAKEKELDLWKNFSCWVSAPLPASVPFRRTVCFEYNQKIGSLVEQLSLMFLAMMPIFNNTESTVITPLLGTGNQGYNGDVVLSAMVDGACHWIQAGLPLHCLKIVVYSQNPSELNDTDKKYLKLFARLKAKWSLTTDKAKISQRYDICLSFSPADKEIADKVTASLQRQAPDARIHSTHFQFNHELLWQTDIFDVMKESRKIIILLTPAYLEDTECIEQFNLALCCNRFKKAEVVIPFHMKTVASFPSYMSIVQYVECSLFGDDETAAAVIESACSDVIKSLEPVTASPDDDTDQEGLETLTLGRGTTYDIFVSYSHRHSKEPEELIHVLRTQYPHLNVFFDQKDLKAGNIWQQAVYEAADKARCVVAFLTPGYLASPVCNEEFNITLARLYSHASVLLVPVVTDNLLSVPGHLTSVPCVDLGCAPGNIARFAAKLAELVNDNKSRVDIPEVTIFKHMMAHKRRVNFIDQFHSAGNTIVTKSPQQFLDMLEGEVVFSYAQDSLKLAAIMSVILKQRSPKLVCQLKSASHSRQRRQHLDTADMVIYFVSDQFVSTQSLVEELHTGLCRQRTVKDSTIVYFIQVEKAEEQIENPHVERMRLRGICRGSGRMSKLRGKTRRTFNQTAVGTISSWTLRWLLNEGTEHVWECPECSDCNHVLPAPFYFQALPFSVSLDDSLWQALEYPVVKGKHSYHVDIPGMEGTYRCTDAQSYALTVAAIDVLRLLSQRDLGSQVAHGIVNVIQAENAADGIGDSLVSAQEIAIPIDSLTQVMPKQHAPRELPKLAHELNHQPETSIGEVTGSHHQKILGSRDDSKLKHHSQDDMPQLPPSDDHRQETGEPSSVQLVEPGASRGSDSPGTTTTGPQTATLRQSGQQMGSQSDKREQKSRRKLCCIL